LQNNHILTAAYDGFIKLFDFRVHEQAQLSFYHQEQLESIALFPSNLTFAAAGGNKVSLWDLRTAKPLFEGRNNKKIVSCVKVIKDGSRFITTSYDNYLKIYKADTF
jgi:WD40 repeat protein